MSFPNKICLPHPGLSIASHESSSSIVVGLIDGGSILTNVQSHKLTDADESQLAKLSVTHPFKDSCRALTFMQSSASFLAGVSGGTVLQFNEKIKDSVQKYILPNDEENQPSASLLRSLEENLAVVGDDSGGLHLLDLRQPNYFATSVLEQGDYISEVIPVDQFGTKALLVASGDGTLSAYDFRKPPKARLRLQYASDSFDDDLLSLAVIPSASLVVAGTLSGAINMYNLRFLDKEFDAETAAHVDRFYGHPECVNTILTHGDDGVTLTASSDGIIRVVDVAKKSLLGVLQYDMSSPDFNEQQNKAKRRKRNRSDIPTTWPIESMVQVAGMDKSCLALLGHDEFIRFCDASILDDDDVDDEKEDIDDKQEESTKETDSTPKKFDMKNERISEKETRKASKKSKRFNSASAENNSDFFDGL